MSDFKAKMHKKIDFCWNSAADPAVAAYSAPPDPLAVFNGMEGEGKGKGEVRGQCRINHVADVANATDLRPQGGRRK